MAKNQEAATHCHSMYMRFQYRGLMLVFADLVKGCAVTMHLNIQGHTFPARVHVAV